MTTAGAPKDNAKPVPEAHRADRLRAAWKLVSTGRVKKSEKVPDRFFVAGNAQRYYTVDLTTDPPCDCADMLYRGGSIANQCKHVLAARLANLDPSLLNTLASVFVAFDPNDPSKYSGR